MTRQVILDTETTGLDPSQGHRIIEIACVEMINRRLTRNNFYKRIHPERAIDEGATQVHGITLEDLENEPKFAEIADEFLAYARGAELVIHNAPFDVGFLNAELTRLKKPLIGEICTVTDTLAMARDLHPGKKNSLDALCDRYQIDNSARTLHGALLDAELLSDVYIAMTRGQDSLAIGLESSNGTHGGGNGVLNQDLVFERPPALKVLCADAEEVRLHAEQIGRINKASGGKAVWSILDDA
ncbi:MAG: DNA polymerase III subunit epsilon [Betaproteobacteria bacterium]|nr:DNA polymerase III subunit epsilon [Betaproteobacteria bacterium]